jgi:hypothetical protein
LIRAAEKTFFSPSLSSLFQKDFSYYHTPAENFTDFTSSHLKIKNRLYLGATFDEQ